MTLFLGTVVMPLQSKTYVMTAMTVIALCNLKEPGGILPVMPLI